MKVVDDSLSIEFNEMVTFLSETNYQVRCLTTAYLDKSSLLTSHTWDFVHILKS